MPPLNPSPRPGSPQPSNMDMLIPWLTVGALFIMSLIAAVATMVFGMAQVGIGKSSLPLWYHPVISISECGLALSALGILTLVIISIRRASRNQ